MYIYIYVLKVLYIYIMFRVNILMPSISFHTIFVQAFKISSISCVSHFQSIIQNFFSNWIIKVKKKKKKKE